MDGWYYDYEGANDSHRPGHARNDSMVAEKSFTQSVSHCGLAWYF